MNILISGASGLIGSEVNRLLTEHGHTVLPLRRDTAEVPYWSIDQKTIQLGGHDKIDVVIHLAGENVAQRRWSAARKGRILQSRAGGTRLIAEFFARAGYKPRLIISASATGFYGDRGDEELDEESGKGSGFLADVSQAWEEATQPAKQAGIRVVNMRFGMVLSPDGGALARVLPLFKMGLGGPLGKGRQYMSWVALQDVAQAVLHIMEKEELHGPVNMVAPHPVTNRQFTRALGRVLCRPAFFTVPKFFLSLFLGEMAQELLFASARVYPRKLQASGYTFAMPDIESALQRMLR